MMCNMINIIEIKELYVRYFLHRKKILKILFTGYNMRGCRSRRGCI